MFIKSTRLTEDHLKTSIPQVQCLPPRIVLSICVGRSLLTSNLNEQLQNCV